MTDIKKNLDSISPTMCYAKWYQVLLNLQIGSSASCCLTPARFLPLDNFNSPDNLHNHTRAIHDRKQLLDGIKIPECSSCWEAEDKGVLSDRIVKSSNDWSLAGVQNYTNESYHNPSPTYVEVSFSSLCQLSCAYCSVGISTGVEDDIKKWGAYPDTTGHNHLGYHMKRGQKIYRDNEHNPYIDHFFNWLPQIYQGLKVLRLTGGEPLLTRHIFRLFDWITNNPNPETELIINSNLSMSEEALLKGIERLRKIPRSHYKNIEFILSLDGIGPMTEFVRNGLSIERFQKNMKILLEEFPDAKISITCTVNFFSLHETRDLIDYVETLKMLKRERPIVYSAYPLFSPEFLSLHQAPELWKEEGKAILKHLETKSDLFTPIEREYMKKALLPLEEAPNESKARVKALDLYLFLVESQRRKRLSFKGPSVIKTYFEELKNNLSSILHNEKPHILLRALPYIDEGPVKEDVRSRLRTYFLTAKVSEHSLFFESAIHPPRYVGEIDFFASIFKERPQLYPVASFLRRIDPENFPLQSFIQGKEISREDAFYLVAEWDWNDDKLPTQSELNMYFESGNSSLASFAWHYSVRKGFGRDTSWKVWLNESSPFELAYAVREFLKQDFNSVKVQNSTLNLLPDFLVLLKDKNFTPGLDIIFKTLDKRLLYQVFDSLPQSHQSEIVKQARLIRPEL
jgi:MoaA/NifB/PqqE/SkfB family radical SAM enzyme